MVPTGMGIIDIGQSRYPVVPSKWKFESVKKRSNFGSAVAIGNQIMEAVFTGKSRLQVAPTGKVAATSSSYRGIGGGDRFYGIFWFPYLYYKAGEAVPSRRRGGSDRGKCCGITVNRYIDCNVQKLIWRDINAGSSLFCMGK